MVQISVGNAWEYQFDATRQHRTEKDTSGCSQLFQVSDLSVGRFGEAVFARVNALCNLSRKKSREVAAAHLRADF